MSDGSACAEERQNHSASLVERKEMPLSPSQYSHHKANCLEESDLTTLNVISEDPRTLVFHIGLSLTSSPEFDESLHSSGDYEITFL